MAAGALTLETWSCQLSERVYASVRARRLINGVGYGIV